MIKRVCLRLDSDDMDKLKEIGVKPSETVRFLIKWYLTTGIYDRKMPIFLPKASKRTRQRYIDVLTEFGNRKEIKETVTDLYNRIPLSEAVESAIREENIDATGVSLFGYVPHEMVNAVYKNLTKKGIATTRDAVVVAMEDYFKL